MSYVVYFDCSDLSHEVIQQAKILNQSIIGISATNDDMLRIEFTSSRRFEQDMFLAGLNANKNSTYYDRFEVKQ